MTRIGRSGQRLLCARTPPAQSTAAKATSARREKFIGKLPSELEPVLGPEFLEAEHAGGIHAEHLATRVFADTAHLALDRLGRMRPGAFVMGIVVGPHEIVLQAVLFHQREAGAVFAEGRE